MVSQSFIPGLAWDCYWGEMVEDMSPALPGPTSVTAGKPALQALASPLTMSMTTGHTQPLRSFSALCKRHKQPRLLAVISYWNISP